MGDEPGPTEAAPEPRLGPARGGGKRLKFLLWTVACWLFVPAVQVLYYMGGIERPLERLADLDWPILAIGPAYWLYGSIIALGLMGWDRVKAWLWK